MKLDYRLWRRAMLILMVINDTSKIRGRNNGERIDTVVDIVRLNPDERDIANLIGRVI